MAIRAEGDRGYIVRVAVQDCRTQARLRVPDYNSGLTHASEKLTRGTEGDGADGGTECGQGKPLTSGHHVAQHDPVPGPTLANVRPSGLNAKLAGAGEMRRE
jgi:hypothetical protein